MIIIGADESGTGAWAGPFTVCAVAIHDHDDGRMKALGVNDSKVLSDAKRRSLLDSIIDLAIIARCEFVSVTDIQNMGPKPAWRMAMVQAILPIAKNGSHKVIVDGNADHPLAALLKTHGIKAEFRVQADSIFPVVSAASIIAKTLRNDAMIALHNQYPEYNWNINAGYGTTGHDVALKKHGKTIHHRPWKNLVDIPLRESE